MSDGPMFYITRSGTVHTTSCPALVAAAEAQPWEGTFRSPRDRRCQRCFPSVTIPPRPPRDAKPGHDAH